MSLSLRHLFVAAVVVGVVAGLAAALAVPRTKTAGEAAPPTGVVPSPDGVVRIGAPLRVPTDQGYVQLRTRTTPRIQARSPDPDGGPDWVVRVFRAERVVPADSRRPGVSPVVGRNLCAQLGRLHRGEFGWLDARGTFRAAPVALTGVPTNCGSRRAAPSGGGAIDVRTTITDPEAPASEPKVTVAWGLAGRGAERIDLRLGEASVTGPRRSRDGAWLLAIRGPQPERGLHGRIAYRERSVTVVDGVPRRARPRHPVPSIPRFARRTAAQAPDPNGGLPFGVAVARHRDGRVCWTFGGRVVGDALGVVDYRLDTISGAFGGGSSCGGPVSRGKTRFPVAIGWGAGLGGDELGDDDARRARVVRRTQRGSTVFAGTVDPDVVAVTFVTPRDVRTLRPTNGAVIVAYDGRFAAGESKVIARMKDGTSRTLRIPAPPM